MSFNFMVSPGTILKEYMDERNITQKELAQMTDSSERHVSNLINAKVKLTEEFALKLEKVFADVRAEFWLDIEYKYRLHILRGEDTTEDLDKISKEYQFAEVFKGLGYSLYKQGKEMLKIIGYKNFNEADKDINKFCGLNYNFMEDDGNKKAMYVWIKLCEKEIDIQNTIEQFKSFDCEHFKNELPILKKLLYTNDFSLAEKNIRRFLNNSGIKLVILDAITNSKIRGATSIIEGAPVIFLTTRFKRLDTFYFALIHEIAHILKKYDDKGEAGYQCSYEQSDEEVYSNEFARNFFIEKKEYDNFISNIETEEDITKEKIIAFSMQQKVIVDIIIGFLEHDKHILNYSKFSYLKTSIS